MSEEEAGANYDMRWPNECDDLDILGSRFPNVDLLPLLSSTNLSRPVRVKTDDFIHDLEFDQQRRERLLIRRPRPGERPGLSEVNLVH